MKPRNCKLTNFFVAALATLRVSLTPSQATTRSGPWKADRGHQHDNFSNLSLLIPLRTLAWLTLALDENAGGIFRLPFSAYRRPA